MSEITEAADYIKRQSALQRGFVLLAEQLDRIGSLEQAEKETRNRLGDLRGAVPGAQAELDRIKAGIAEAEDAAATILLDASNAAKVFSDDASAKAREQAEQTIATATSNASQTLANANAKADQVRADYQAVQVLSDGLKETVSSQRDAIAASRAELDRINAEVEALKAKFA